MDLTPEVAAILSSLVAGIGEALGDNLVGVYLRGSLATGDFDPQTSDVDFFTVTESVVTPGQFGALAALHHRLSASPNRYGENLEGAYIPRVSARRYVPGERHPTIYRGEALAPVQHRANWVLERWAVRRYGLALLGPDPAALIDPVSPGELREAVRRELKAWEEYANTPDDPDWQLHRGHKAYVVETMCRALYTLSEGELAGKPRSVQWALQTLPEPWRTTVHRSQGWRADTTRDPSIVPEVIAFVRWAALTGRTT